MRYLQQWRQDGNWRIRFRRPGFKSTELTPPPGYRGDKAALGNSHDFLASYLAANNFAITPATRGANGTIEWLRVEYFRSIDFLERPDSMRPKIKRNIEDFCERVKADLPVGVIDQIGIEELLATMLDMPSKANEWLASVRDFLQFAVKRGLLKANPAIGIKKRKSKNPEGHHCWTPEEVAVARAKFPLGSKMRLAIELINALAFRRGDVIRVGKPLTYAGHLEDGRSATFLKYVQDKNDENKPITVDAPMPTDLLGVIHATPIIGAKTWLVDSHGKAFTKQAFTDWFSREIAKAGLPARCVPHGLRKRCLTDMADRGLDIHAIMAISGHLTVKEIERYTRMANRARNAERAIGSRA